MSIRPNDFSTSLTSWVMDSGSLTSQANPAASPPSSVATADARSTSRPTTATRAPPSTSAFAIARPMPRVLPVTIADRPVKSSFIMPTPRR